MALVTKKRLILLCTFAVLGVAIVFSLGKKPIPVKTTEVKPGELRVVINATTTSTVRAETEVTLSAQRTGRVVALPVREGDRVRAGALVCRLDLTEESLQSESVLAQSRATYEEAEKNLNRTEDLFEKGMIAQQDLDVTRRIFMVAKSQYDAALADAGVKRDYSIIRSPFNGIIAKKFTEVGELLLPGREIVKIVDPDRVYVLAAIDEVDLGRLKPGLPVSITVDAFPGEIFSGTVGRISPIVSGGKLETRTADVWIYFQEKQDRIKPGMSADIEILITTITDVLSVPSQAIIERDGRKQVFVAQGASQGPGSIAKARLTPVEPGETNWSFTEIRKGISAGDHVITTPETEGLKDGVAVQVQE